MSLSLSLIGIMLLEKQLLINVTQSSNKSSKRSKGSHVSEATETWVESARYNVVIMLAY